MHIDERAHMHTRERESVTSAKKVHTGDPRPRNSLWSFFRIGSVNGWANNLAWTASKSWCSSLCFIKKITIKSQIPNEKPKNMNIMNFTHMTINACANRAVRLIKKFKHCEQYYGWLVFELLKRTLWHYSLETYHQEVGETSKRK